MAIPSKRCAALDLSRRLRVDGTPGSISPLDLYARLGTAAAPILVDVRRATPHPAEDRLIVSAVHRPPQEVEQWSNLARGRSVVARCSSTAW